MATRKFRGDTPPKKIARAHFWFSVLRRMGNEAFFEGRYLVLAGPEAGDISVLLGLGVPGSHIVAVDRDPEAISEAKARFPTPTYVTDELLNYVGTQPSKFDAILLDVCSNITSDLLATTALTALDVLKPGGLLGVSAQICREQDIKNGMRSAILERRSSFEEEVASLTVEERGHWKGLEPYMARVTLIADELEGMCQNSTRDLAHLEYIFYQSRDDLREDIKGQPFCIYLGQLDAQNPDGPEVYHFKPDKKEFGQFAMQVIEQGYDPALILNAPRTVVAGWKSHASRGTYR